MKHWFLAVLLGCSGSAPGILGDPPPAEAGSDAATDSASVDAGVEAEASVEAGSDACAPVAHWNGWGPFDDCAPVGAYDERLALAACRSYFSSGCGLMADGGPGAWCSDENEVGAKSTDWILWNWTGDAGYALESNSSPPLCANNGAGKPFVAWW